MQGAPPPRYPRGVSHPSSPDPRRAERALALAATFAIGALLAWRHRDLLDADQVAMMELARHWAAGRVDLAVNGSWGPLASWLLVPALWLGVEPAMAARGLVVLLALLLTAGIERLLRVPALPPGTRRLLLAAGSVRAATWCAGFYTGDLPLAVCLTWLGVLLTQSLGDDAAPPARTPVLLLVGLAFTAKPVGLPVGLAMLAAAAFLRPGAPGVRARLAARLVAAGLAGALPWVLAQSLHYGEPTFSRSGALNHALLGPEISGPDLRLSAIRGHPTFSGLHPPAPGRITTWEDPSALPYPAWNPLASGEALARQLEFSRRALLASLDTLRRFDWIGLGLLLTLLGGLAGLRACASEADRLAAFLLAPLATTVALYLPFFVHARYLWPLHPFLLLGVGLALGRWLEPDPAEAGPPRRALRAAALLLPLAAAALLAVAFAGIPPFRQAAHARQLASLLGAPAPGPIATWERAESRGENVTGLFLAAALRVPWLGVAPPGEEGLDAAAAAGARVLLVQRRWRPEGQPEPMEDPPGWSRRGEIHVRDWVNGGPGTWSYRVLVRD